MNIPAWISLQGFREKGLTECSLLCLPLHASWKLHLHQFHVNYKKYHVIQIWLLFPLIFIKFWLMMFLTDEIKLKWILNFMLHIIMKLTPSFNTINKKYKYQFFSFNFLMFFENFLELGASSKWVGKFWLIVLFNFTVFIL